MELKEKILSLVTENINESGLRKTDEKDTLECFCADNPPNNDFEKTIRGYIFDGDNLVMKSQEYPSELKFDEWNENFKCTIMKEGTIIRLFFWKGKWFLTTHRKIDAFKSKWGEESFGDIFSKNIMIKCGKTLEEFYETLDKEKKYIFIVGTSEVTRVVSPSYNDIYLVSVTDLKFNTVSSDIDDWKLPEMSFKSYEEAHQYVESLKYPYENGYGLFITNNEHCYKLTNSKYDEYAKLRHNLPSIMFAYLHNVFDEKNKKLFRDVYKNYIPKFNKYDIMIKNIAKDLQQKYFNRYVKKDTTELPRHENIIVTTLHRYFRETREPIKTKDVYKALKETPVTCLNKIIKNKEFELKKNNG